jgi:ornithine cyclodeaminase/alanine dehydrogenase-like protein (mu-crystallin family)
MCAGDELLRERRDEITIYKSVGVALQDLAAAQLCVEGRS